MFPIRNDLIDIKCGDEIVVRYEVLSIDDATGNMVLHKVEVYRAGDKKKEVLNDVPEAKNP
jgi:hypothetical protein